MWDALALIAALMIGGVITVVIGACFIYALEVLQRVAREDEHE